MATLDTSETYLTPSDIAQELKLDPSAPVRWMRKGILFSDESRRILQHIRVPGGYRVKRAWLDEFLHAVTEDRAGRAAPPVPKPARSQRIQRLDAALAAAGF